MNPLSTYAHLFFIRTGKPGGAFSKQRAKAALRVGNVCIANGDLTEAETYFKAAVVFDRTLPEAWTRLGSLYSKQGKHLEAIEALSAALDHDVKPDTLYEIGVAMMRSGNTQDAIGYLEKALVFDAKNCPTWIQLGICHSALGNGSKAIECYEKALSIDPFNPHAMAKLDVEKRIAASEKRNT